MLTKTTDDVTYDVDTLYQDVWADVQPESSRRVLIAALESFAANGFAGSTTRQIAERAEMSSTGLYVNFKSKSDLLFTIVRTANRFVLQEVTEVAAKDLPAAEKLREFVEAFVVFHARYHLLAFVGEYELRALTGEPLTQVIRLRHQYRNLVEGILIEGIASGDFEVTDLRSATRTILSLGTDVARWFRDDGPLAPLDVARQQSDLVLRMVRRVPRA